MDAAGLTAGKNPEKPHPLWSRPLVPLTIAMMAGIWVGDWQPDQPMLAAMGIGIGLGLALVHRRARPLPFVLVAAACWGYLLIQPQPPAPSYLPVSAFCEKSPVTVFGTVDEIQPLDQETLRLVIACISIVEQGQPHPVYGRIRTTVIGAAPVLGSGDGVRLEARLRSIRNFGNPGGFDSRRHYRRQGIMATAFVEGREVARTEQVAAGGLVASVAKARTRLGNRIDTVGASPQARAIVKALIIGDTSSIDDTLRRTFNRTGLGHLLSISGLHVGIVATVGFFLFRRLLVLFPLVLRQALARKGGALLALFPVIGYGLLAGMAPPTQRAVIMVAVFLAALWWEQDNDTPSALALAALIILILDPAALFSVSFQLSFAAVAWILLGVAGAMTPSVGEASKILRLGIGAWNLTKVSFWATIGTLPLVMAAFNQLPLVGIAANIVMVPIYGFAVVPTGLLAVGLYPISTASCAGLLALAAWMVEATLAPMQMLADLRFASLTTFTPTLVEIAAFYVLAWAGLDLWRRGRNLPEGNGRLHWRSPPLAAWAAGLALACLGADALYWGYQRFWRDDLRVTVIDVGQGASVLVEFPRGPVALVDGGGFGDRSRFDVGEAVVAPLLWRRKIMTVDTLVLTHADADHLNGLVFITENFNVGQLWTNGQGSASAKYQQLMQIVDRRAIVAPPLGQLPRHQQINGVAVDLLYPSEGFLERCGNDPWRDPNNNGLVLKLAMGKAGFLIPGDIKAPAEAELVQLAGADLAATVLVAPHHGSKTSSTPAFIDAVKPKVTVASVGWHNRFHFPHPSVAQRLAQAGSKVLRTDLDGAVQIVTDGRRLRVVPFLSPAMEISLER